MNRDRALWVGVLTGPIIWLVSFLANFALAPWTCLWRSKLALYTVSVVAFAITSGAGMLSWREWMRLRTASANGDDGRARSMAVGGMMLSSLSLLVIIGQGFVEAVVGECQ